MYDLENIQSGRPEFRQINNLPAFRMLLQSQQIEIPSLNNSTTSSTNSTAPIPNEPTTQKLANYTDGGILINGNGIAGIGVTILFLIPVLIGSCALMSTFVNTKFLDQPLRIKIMD